MAPVEPERRTKADALYSLRNLRLIVMETLEVLQKGGFTISARRLDLVLRMVELEIVEVRDGGNTGRAT